MVVDGVEWVTTGDACERLAPDVTHGTLRNWIRAGRVALLRNRGGQPVRLHRQYLVRWSDVVEAEHAARTEPAGRPRTGNVGESLKNR